MKIKNLFSKLWPVSFIAIVWSIFSWPFWAKGLVPFPSNYLVSFFPPWQYFHKVPPYNSAMPDVLSQLYPWKHLVIEIFKSGQFPLWNPYSFSGTPLLANFQSAVFSPLNFLFFIFPFATGWSLLILLQPLLAAFFMFLLLQELKVSRLGGLVSGVAFGFCGFVVVWMAYGTLSLTMAFLPLLLLAIEKNFKKNNVLNLTLVSVSIAFSILSGHFQTSIYIFLAGAVYAGFKFWQTKKLRTFLLVALFSLLGLALSSPQIFPSIELYLNSVRGVSFKQTETIPFSYLATLLAPDFFGNPVTGNNWFGHYAEWASFSGVWPFLLGVFAFWRGKKNKEIAFFFALGVIALLLALDTPFAALLLNLKIPVISGSAASRLIVIFSFSFAVLAGFGIDILAKDWEKKENLKKIFLYLLGAGTVFIFLWVLVLFSNFFPPDKLAVAKRNLILPSLIFISGGFLLLSGFWLKKWKTIILIIILVLVSFDLLRFAKKWMPFEDKNNLYPQLTVIKFLQDNIGEDRVFGNFGNELGSYFHISSIEGYDPLYPRRYKELVSAAGNGKIGDLFADRSTVLLEKNGQYAENLLSLLGVKYILYAKDDGWSTWVFPFWKNLEAYDLSYDGPKYQVLKIKNALPRAYLAGNIEVINDKQKIIDRLLSDDFLLQKKVILEEEPKEKISSGEGKVEIISYTPNKVKIEVDQKNSQLLYLSDNYYPGWQAKVDNQPVKIYRTNYTFRSVFVQEGKHTVEFIYDPKSFKIGVFLSAGVLIFLILANMIPSWRRKFR